MSEKSRDLAEVTWEAERAALRALVLDALQALNRMGAEEDDLYARGVVLGIGCRGKFLPR